MSTTTRKLRMAGVPIIALLALTFAAVPEGPGRLTKAPQQEGGRPSDRDSKVTCRSHATRQILQGGSRPT